MWAQYLEFLKQSKLIINWWYEHKTFYFNNEKTAPVQYTPDFKISNIETIYYQEFKRGFLDGQAVTKFRRMAKHYPDIIIELVMMGILKKESHQMFIAKKYVRRIVDASAIFKQMGKLIISAKDYRAGKELELKKMAEKEQANG